MTILIIENSGAPQWSIPAGETTKIYGTTGVDTLNIAQGANVVFDTSFNAGIDIIHIQGKSTDFTVKHSGAIVTLLDSSGATIVIPAGSVGQELTFIDGEADLVIKSGVVMLGTQTITTTLAPITAIAIPTDTIAPTLVSGTPADNSTGVAVGSNITLTFSENIKLGTGTIGLYDVATDKLVPAAVTVAGKIATINPTANLSNGTAYYLNVAAGAIKDIAGNNFAGITGETAFNFTTIAAPDTIAPTLVSGTPADNSTGVAVASDITLTFSENIKLGTGTAGTIGLYDVATDKLVPAAVTVAGKIATINPTANLSNGTAYYLNVAAGAIKDIAGNNFAGITGETAFNFTTIAAPDTIAPTLVSGTPADNSTGVAVASDITLTFSENIKLGTGTVGLYDVATDKLVPAAVTVAGKIATINPTANLSNGTAYYLNVAAGAIKDIAGNNFTGITGETAFNFTTVNNIINKSLDTGTMAAQATLDAANGSFNFTDAAKVESNVVINNFTADDIITVSKDMAASYTFSNDGANVVIMSNETTGIINLIILTGVVGADSLVYNEASFEAAIGFNAFTFV